MNEAFTITSALAADQRRALEQMLFFNVNQHRVLDGIQRCIQNYGVPEIVEHDGHLSIKVGAIEGVQTLFAVSKFGCPLGLAVFVRPAQERFVVLHLVVEPRLRSTLDVNTPVLLELMHAIRTAARSMQGIDRIECVYNDGRAVRLSN